MNLFKVLAVSFILFSVSANAEIIQRAGGGKFYAPVKFEEFKSKANTWNYNEQKIGYTYSCGPMSMLYVHNYYTFVNEGKPDELSKSLDSVKSAIERQYTNIGVRINDTTSFSDLRKMANKWQWHVKNATEKDYGMPFFEYIKKGLAEDKITIVNLKKEAKITPFNMEHFIAVMGVLYPKADTKDPFVIYFDPWVGELKTTTQSVLERDSISSRSVMQVKGF